MTTQEDKSFTAFLRVCGRAVKKGWRSYPFEVRYLCEAVTWFGLGTAITWAFFPGFFAAKPDPVDQRGLIVMIPAAAWTLLRCAFLAWSKW